MAALDLSRAAWRKSSRSNGSQDNCVEVAAPGSVNGVVAVRDSKNPHGAKLAFPARAWTTFTTATKHGTLA